MKLTLRMRITLLTGVVMLIMAILLTTTSIYVAELKIKKFADEAAVMAVEIQATDTVKPLVAPVVPFAPLMKSIEVALVDNQVTEYDQTAGTVKAMKIRTLSTAYAQPAKTVSSEFNYTSLWIMSAIVLLGMLTCYYMAGRALKPVHSLSQATANISERNLTQRLKENGKGDEVGKLTDSFNSMLNRLEESFYRQKRFAANAAHELKTPLTTMKAGIQVLEISEEPTTEQYQETLGVMKKQVQRLSNVVEDLLLLTNEGYTEDKEYICINTVISEIVKELEPVAKEKKINIKIQGYEEELFILGSETLTYRVFYNLIENAIKYNKPEGMVIVEKRNLLSNEGNKAVVRIHDTGEGILPEETEKIFEPFYCIEPSRSRKLGGAGLGLSIVKDIVNRYGWEITVESKENMGTIFQVTMPVLLDL